MTEPFIEERLSVGLRIGHQWEDSFALVANYTANGSRFASLKHPLPSRVFSLAYLDNATKVADEVISLFYRTYGGFAGFRVKTLRDFTTAIDGVSPYSSLDCALTPLGSGVYQFVKEYGRDKPGLAGIGRPKRTIFKPVPGRAVYAVAGLPYPNGGSIDTTTGQLHLVANKTAEITGIVKGATTSFTGANTFTVNESVALKDITGISALNGRRALVTARSSSSFTLAINSSSMSGSYVSGGTAQTWPLDTGGDIVTGGCEFDLPVVFDSALPVSPTTPELLSVSSMTLREMLNI